MGSREVVYGVTEGITVQVAKSIAALHVCIKREGLEPDDYLQKTTKICSEYMVWNKSLYSVFNMMGSREFSCGFMKAIAELHAAEFVAVPRIGTQK